MASEVLAIPEEDVAEVILVIKAGLRSLGSLVPSPTRAGLLDWCEEFDHYLDAWREEDA